MLLEVWQNIRQESKKLVDNEPMPVFSIRLF